MTSGENERRLPAAIVYVPPKLLQPLEPETRLLSAENMSVGVVAGAARAGSGFPFSSIKVHDEGTVSVDAVGVGAAGVGAAGVAVVPCLRST